MKAMKKTISSLLLTSLFLLAVSATSQAGTRPTLRMHFDQSFSRLEVEDGITVVLTNESDNTISIEGAYELTRHFRATVKKRCLYIWLSGRSDGEKVTVYVPARYLKQISVNGSSGISSGNTLFNSGLTVNVNGPCRLDIRSMGPIEVRNGEGYEYKSGIKR